MKLNEEKELNQITEEFSKAMESFAKKDFKKAQQLFETIIENYRDSEFYSVLEIHARSKVYQNISKSQLNPIKPKLSEDDDYLYEGIYHLNAGEYNSALDMFKKLEEKKFKDPYLHYLLSLVYLKTDDIDQSLKYLKKCVEKDDVYKVIAHNESDFDPLFEREEFKLIIT